MTPAKVRLAMASMGKSETSVAALCKDLEVTRQILYRHVSPTGELREDGRKLLTGSQLRILSAVVLPVSGVIWRDLYLIPYI